LYSFASSYWLLLGVGLVPLVEVLGGKHDIGVDHEAVQEQMGEVGDWEHP